MEKFISIALKNFKFKIISKIIVDRLTNFMPNIDSKDQIGFIKGRCIRDGIYITIEAINHLDNMCFRGNLAIKVVIAKALATISLDFFLYVLKKFGSNFTLCKWIHAILASSFLFVSINGKFHGYFNCSRESDKVTLFHLCFFVWLKKF